MQTYEIPREQWPAAVTSFGEDHLRWRVSVSVLGADIGAQPEVNDMPLEGLSVEPSDQGGSVLIFVERSIGEHLTHVIKDPVHIRVEEGDGGRHAMQIEAADGTKTIATFSRA